MRALPCGSLTRLVIKAKRRNTSSDCEDVAIASTVALRRDSLAFRGIEAGGKYEYECSMKRLSSLDVVASALVVRVDR